MESNFWQSCMSLIVLFGNQDPTSLVREIKEDTSLWCKIWLCAPNNLELKKKDNGSSFNAIYCTPRQHENILGPENHLLVEQYEERSDKICVSILDLSASQE